MKLKGIKIGLAITGSHCTLKDVMAQVPILMKAGAELFPILSNSVSTNDTRFGKAQDWKDFLENTTGNKVIDTIISAEPIGPKKLLDVVVIAPCTGNTIAKLTGGITDTPVLMAAKAHLRNERPVIIGISTNDGLGINAKNIGLLLNMKNIYMVPFGQDNPETKSNSLVAKMDKLEETIEYALEGKQIQPVIVQYTV